MITITSEAAGRVKNLLVEKGVPNAHLRVYISAGGCSGLSYGMALVESPGEGDTVVEANGVKLLVDSMSAPYLQGAEVDYSDSMMGAGFTVKNPNAVSSCGCGSSFKTKEQAAEEGNHDHAHAHDGGCSSGGCGHH